MATATIQNRRIVERATGEHPIAAPPPARMPINPVEREKRLSSGITRTARHAVESIREAAARIYCESRARTLSGYARLSDKTQELAGETRDVARYVRRDYPVQLLGVLAGSAFLAGVALRVWRSRS